MVITKKRQEGNGYVLGSGDDQTAYHNLQETDLGSPAKELQFAMLTEPRDGMVAGVMGSGLQI